MTTEVPKGRVKKTAARVATQSRRIARRGLIVRLRLRWRLRRERRLQPAWPAVALRCVGIAVCVFLLVVIASAVGTPAGKSTVLGKGALLTTIGKGPVAIVLAAILVLMIGGLFRRIAFEYLVRLPGPILVRDLAVSSTSNAGVAVHPQPAGASDLAGIDVVQLSNTFRRRLQELRLQAPTPIPGAVAPQDYLDLLDAQHLNTNNPLGSLISALRAAAPTHGYEVSPSLVVERASSSECRYRITTQVTRLPHGALPVETTVEVPN